MFNKLLTILPGFSFIFLAVCLGIWLGVNRYTSSLTHERQCLIQKQDALTELTKKWKTEYEKQTSHDAGSELIHRIQQNLLNDQEERTQEYKELYLIKTAVEQKTFNEQISKMADIRNKMYQYIQGYTAIAEQMNRRAK